MAFGRHLGTPLCLALILACTACVSEPSASLHGGSANPSAAVSSSQIGTATYSCADGGMMTIQNLGTSVRLLGPDGVMEELPASPADQNSRYGAAHDAIVLDGREALVMKGGQTPLTCTR